VDRGAKIEQMKNTIKDAKSIYAVLHAEGWACHEGDTAPTAQANNPGNAQKSVMGDKDKQYITAWTSRIFTLSLV
jgi:hypothetical protein